MKIQWVVLALFVSWAISLSCSASTEVLGVWQRVYDECGTWKPTSQSEMFEKARYYTPFREVILVFEEDQTYSAHVGFSRACSDPQLKTHSTVRDCRKGVNRGSYSISEEQDEILLNAIFQSDLQGLWGGSPIRFRLDFVNQVLILTQPAAAICDGQPWNIYFLNFATS